MIHSCDSTGNANLWSEAESGYFAGLRLGKGMWEAWVASIMLYAICCIISWVITRSIRLQIFISNLKFMHFTVCNTSIKTKPTATQSKDFWLSLI